MDALQYQNDDKRLSRTITYASESHGDKFTFRTGEITIPMKSTKYRVVIQISWMKPQCTKRAAHCTDDVLERSSGLTVRSDDLLLMYKITNSATR